MVQLHRPSGRNVSSPHIMCRQLYMSEPYICDIFSLTSFYFVRRHHQLTFMNPPFDLTAYNVWDPMGAIERMFLDDVEWKSFHLSFEKARAHIRPFQKLQQSSRLVDLLSMDYGPTMMLRDYLPAVDQNAVAASCWRLRPYHISSSKAQTLQQRSVTVGFNEGYPDQGTAPRIFGQQRKVRKGGIWREQCYISFPLGYFDSFTYHEATGQQILCPPPY